MVTMRWWDDLWLNEGFANTLMYFALDAIYEPWKVVSIRTPPPPTSDIKLRATLASLQRIRTRDGALYLHVTACTEWGVWRSIQVTQSEACCAPSKWHRVRRVALHPSDTEWGVWRFIQVTQSEASGASSKWHRVRHVALHPSDTEWGVWSFIQVTQSEACGASSKWQWDVCRSMHVP